MDEPTDADFRELISELLEGAYDESPDAMWRHVRYYTRFGIFTQHWGMMENALDFLICTLFWFHGAADMDPRGKIDFPVSLETRISLVKLASKKIAAFAEHAKRAVAAVNAIAGMKEQRHTMVHATPLHVREDGSVVFYKVKMTPLGPTIDYPIIRANAIERMLGRVEDVTHELSDLGVLLMPEHLRLAKPAPLSPEAARLAKLVARRTGKPLKSGAPSKTPERGGPDPK